MQVSEMIIQYLHNCVDMSTSEKSYLHIVIVACILVFCIKCVTLYIILKCVSLKWSMISNSSIFIIS